MTTAPALDTEPTTDNGNDDGPGMVHYFCKCNRDRALCGKDISDHPEVFGNPLGDNQACMVCDDLGATPCKRCNP